MFRIVMWTWFLIGLNVNIQCMALFIWMHMLHIAVVLFLLICVCVCVCRVHVTCLCLDVLTHWNVQYISRVGSICNFHLHFFIFVAVVVFSRSIHITNIYTIIINQYYNLGIPTQRERESTFYINISL